MSGEDAVAIIGAALRLPEAETVDRFAANLAAGRESVRFYSREALLAAGLPPALIDDPLYVAAGADLDQVESFDAAFFGLSALEAAITDPQHRLLLELSWHALEDAACDPRRFDGAIGLYAGLGPPTYLLNHLLRHPDLEGRVSPYQLLLGNDKDFAPTRVAYRLGLSGPAINVNTACSSSLVAIHLAAQALIDYQVDLAIAGGVSLQLPQLQGYRYEEGGIGSRDGHCRPFDAAASGTVSGNGGGVVVLKRLEDALRDGDPVDAVLLGSAINNDGNDKVGYTAPSLNGQAAVIREALAVAGVEPATIGYVEAHGTATALGDPIEVAALREALGERRIEGGVAIGSVKSNIGHLDAAAGVAGLIKAVRMVRDGWLYPTLHYTQPNPALALQPGEMWVVDRLQRWPPGVAPRRAGVSSFGIGGTNAHLIIEQPPAAAVAPPPRPLPLPLPLSARTPAALPQQAARLADWIAGQESPPPLADLAWSLASGRSRLRFSSGVVAADPQQAVTALRQLAAGGGLAPVECEEGAAPPGVVFMFSGQGSQWAGMGASLYRQGGASREVIDRGLDLLSGVLGESLRDLLLPPAGGEAAADARLRDTRYAQPLLLLTELALVAWLESVGIRPVALAGHSLGEWSAAVVAGVIGAEDALRLVSRRAALMAAMAPGAMVAVSAESGQLTPLLPAGVTIALCNGPTQLVAGGPSEGVELLEQRLCAAGLEHRRLETSHAFHTAMMEPMLDQWRAELAGVTLRPPQLPLLSNRSGDWADGTITSVDYWVDQLRSPVRFDLNLERLFERPERLLLEVGPGRALTTLARRHPRAVAGQPLVATLPDRQSQREGEPLQQALLQLHGYGVALEWPTICGEGRRRLHLPGYPFARTRHWIDPVAAAPVGVAAASGDHHPAAGGGAARFWCSAWRAASPPAPGSGPDQRPGWLVIAPQSGAVANLAQRLIARIGAAAGSPRVVRLASDQPGELLTQLQQPAAPQRWRLLHLLDLAGGEPATPTATHHRWMALLRALPAAGDPLIIERIDVVVDQAFAIGDQPVQPDRALLAAPLRVARQERPGLVTRLIDLPPAASCADWQGEGWLERLWLELSPAATESRVALRQSGRYLQRVEPFESPADAAEGGWREGGLYLITGGYGAIALLVATALISRYRARVVLAGRRPAAALPASRRQQVEQLTQLAARSGGGVIAEWADLAVAGAVDQLIDRVERDHGPIEGVIHAAGVTDAATLLQPLAASDPQVEATILTPKVNATLQLAQRLARSQQPPRFVLLLSSTASLLGGAGMASYSAASAWLDSWAQLQGQTSGATRWICSNWDAWPTEALWGEAEEAPHSSDPYQLAVGEGERMLVELVALALRPGGPSQLFVAGDALPERLQRWGEAGVTASALALKEVDDDHALTTAGLVARIWGGQLGVESPAPAADLFALGGDSLVAVQIASRLRDRLGPLVTAGDLLERPRLGDLVALVEGRLQALQAVSDLEGGESDDDEEEGVL